jgi:hypothetical protein
MGCFIFSSPNLKNPEALNVFRSGYPEKGCKLGILCPESAIGSLSADVGVQNEGGYIRKVIPGKP